MRLSSYRGFPTMAALLVGSLLWLGAPAPGAEAVGPKAPATLEDQLKFLSSALAESFKTGDWEMLEMVAGGIKAAGLKDGALEIFTLSAERDAALSTTPGPAAVTIVTWGLAFRARLGGEQAAAALREKAFAEVTPVERPKGGGGPAAMEAWKAWHACQQALSEKRSALLALAMLGEKKAGEAAWESVQTGAGDLGGGMNGSGRELVMAVIAAQREAGWKKLVEFCSFEGGNGAPFSARAGALGSLASLAGADRPANRSAAFRLEGVIAGTLPADAPGVLRSAFVKLAGKLPEGDPQFGLLHAARSLPGLREDQAAVDALKALKGRCQGNSARQWDGMIDWMLKEPAKHTGKNTEKTQNPGTVETF